MTNPATTNRWQTEPGQFEIVSTPDVSGVEAPEKQAVPDPSTTTNAQRLRDEFNSQ